MTSFSKALKLHPNWCSQQTASFRTSRRILPVSGQIRQNYPNRCLQMENQSSFLSWPGVRIQLYFWEIASKSKFRFFSAHKFSWVFTTLDVLAKNFPENAKEKEKFIFVEVQLGRDKISIVVLHCLLSIYKYIVHLMVQETWFQTGDFARLEVVNNGDEMFYTYTGIINVRSFVRLTRFPGWVVRRHYELEKNEH